MRTKVNEFEFTVQVNHGSLVTSANAKNPDSKENLWKSGNYSNSNDNFNNEHSNRRVSGFNLAKEDDPWNAGSRYKRHYDSGSKQKKGILESVNLDNPLSMDPNLRRSNSNSNRQPMELKKRDSKASNSQMPEAVSKSRGFSVPHGHAQGEGPIFRGFLFKDEYVFFDSRVRNPGEYMTKVIEYSGNVVKKLGGVKQKLWVVIPDALSEEKGKEYEALKKKMDLRLVSHRWVDYCIEKKYVIKNVEKQINLLPFPCKVPIKAFCGIKICVKGFGDPAEESTIKEVVKIIGADLMPKVSESSYCISNDVGKDVPTVCMDGTDCVKKQFKWIFECIMKEKVVA